MFLHDNLEERDSMPIKIKRIDVNHLSQENDLFLHIEITLNGVTGLLF